PPIVPVPRDGPLPLSMNQEHLWRLDQMIPGTHFFNMPYIYQFSGNLNTAALEKTLKEIIQRHETLRTVFAAPDGKPVQLIQKIYRFQLSVVDLCSVTSDDLIDQIVALVLKEREGPFDLATGPLFRFKLLHVTDEYYLLLVTMHHIISDQWSMRVFCRE